MAQTQTFDTVGEHQWTVPDGVTEVDATVAGAQGGSNADAPGGEGGMTTGSFGVTPGETLYIFVGGQPDGQSGGTNGGARGGNGSGAPTGEGGGGASDIRTGGNTLSDRLLIAGGGGGAGGPNDEGTATGGGAGGGTEGAVGGGTWGGYGGTQSSGGDARVDEGGDGSLGSGGHGADGPSIYDSGGGGGGGGYYGGGGGDYGHELNAGYGGGGGSGFVAGSVSSGSTSQGGNTGNGSVELTYTVEPSAPDNVTATVDADDQITLTWDADRSAKEPTDYDIEIDRDGTGFITPDGGPANVTDDGSSSYSVTHGPASDNSYDSVVGIDSSFRFRVRANSSDNGTTSPWTKSGTVYTSPVPPHAPSASRSGSNSIAIAWTNQSDIESGVEVQYREDTGSGYGAWTTATTTTASATSYSTASLPDDVRRQYRIRTVAPDNGTSKWAYADYGTVDNVYFEDGFESGDLSKWDTTNLSDADSGVYTGSNAPGGGDSGISGPDEGSYHAHLESGDTVIKQLGDLSGESDVIVKCALAAGSLDASSESVGLSWYDGSAWQTLHHFGWEYNKQGWVEVTALAPSSLLSTDNRLRLDSYGGSGDYAEFDRIVVADVLHEYTAPANPSNLSLDASVDREITASWTINASFATKQEVDLVPTDGGDNLHGHLPEDDADYTFTGLQDGVNYESYARSTIGQHRRGSLDKYWYTDSSTLTAVTNLPSVTNLTVESVDGRYVTLSWTDPSNNADGYRLLLREDDSGSYSQDGTDVDPVGEDQAQTTQTTELLDGMLYGATVETFTEHTTAREDQ